ncbi:MogA/MoaB family molybdenum cofactor biosynthesis protein [Bacillaceae bacterium]
MKEGEAMTWKAGILTISDKGAAGEREDESGRILHKLIEEIGGRVVAYRIVPDERALIERSLLELADELGCSLVLTTGGTGFAARDVTPEATKAVIEREAPGLAETMRAATLAKTRFAMLSRATAGIRGRTLIINLPGSPKGVRECFASISDVIPHAVKLLSGDTEH